MALRQLRFLISDNEEWEKGVMVYEMYISHMYGMFSPTLSSNADAKAIFDSLMGIGPL